MARALPYPVETNTNEKRRNNLLHSDPKVMLFLGAGASSFAGYYTFFDFPELLFNAELRQRENFPSLTPNTERILKAIKVSLDRNNIAPTHDNFLWRLDSYTHLLRLNQSDDALQDFLRENTKLWALHTCTVQAINQISGTTVHHYSANRVQHAKQNNPALYGNMRSVYEFYRTLADFNGKNAYLPVFTTNYDMFIEDLTEEFSSKKQKPDILVNGIQNNTHEESAWSPHYYATPLGFHIFRLHGCVCWFYHSREDNNVYLHRRNAIYQETGNMCAMYPGRETKIGLNPHGFAFNNLYRSLQSCEIAVFIGFSFRDDDVLHVFLKALAERKEKPRILIVDCLYTSSDIQNKLKDSASRSAFPSQIPNNAQIKSLKTRFGEDVNVLETILDTCRKLLNSKYVVV
jgi:hypothetical protein